MKNNYYNNSGKSLPDVFKELKEEQRRQASLQFEKTTYQPKKQTKISNINSFKNTYPKNNLFRNNPFCNYNTDVSTHKFNEAGAIIGILFVILFTTTIKSNYIFATSKDDEKRAIGTFEENEEPIQLMEIASQNISEVIKKEIVTEEQIIEKEIEYIENSQLPKDEQVVIEEGNNGKREITYIRSYQDEELIDEKIISENIALEPSKSVVQVGTSKFLADKKAHIGDTIYTVEEAKMMFDPDEDSIQICKIYQYIDVMLEEVIDDKWCKVSVDGLEGYVLVKSLTSENATPGIAEKSRIQRIMISVNPDMDLRQPSGLTRADYVKMLSGNSRDINKIFENNAGLFYDIEQKYNINGIFLAAIGIHESNWGNSTIAAEKKNLFGYGAYDSSPYESSYTFESYEYGIELLAKVLTKYYINEAGTPIYDGETAVGSYYNGPTISGVNTRYASDENWKNRVYEIMEDLYKKLQ